MLPYNYIMIFQAYLQKYLCTREKKQQKTLSMIAACSQQHLLVQTKWKAYSILLFQGATVLEGIHMHLSKQVTQRKLLSCVVREKSLHLRNITGYWKSVN